MEATLERTDTLSDEEREVLFQCERAVKAANEGFRLAGSALRTIRDRRLHRGTHASFVAYVRDEFHFTRARVSQLIGAVEIVNHLRETLDRAMLTMVNILPSNERQIRPLLLLSRRVGRRRILDLEKIGKVWIDVLASAPMGSDGVPRVTAKLVQEVVDRWREADKACRDRDQQLRRARRILMSAFSRAVDPLPNEADAFGAIAECLRTLMTQIGERQDKCCHGAGAGRLRAGSEDGAEGSGEQDSGGVRGPGGAAGDGPRVSGVGAVADSPTHGSAV
jgi:hypothetical protein